jgi:hypothetical protein
MCRLDNELHRDRAERPAVHFTSGVTYSEARSGSCALNTRRAYSRTISTFDPTAVSLAILCSCPENFLSQKTLLPNLFAVQDLSPTRSIALDYRSRAALDSLFPGRR